MKGTLSAARGSLKSKPAWLSTSKVFDHADFFCFPWWLSEGKSHRHHVENRNDRWIINRH